MAVVMPRELSDEDFAALSRITGVPVDQIKHCVEFEFRFAVDERVTWRMANAKGEWMEDSSDVPREIVLNGERYIYWPERLTAAAREQLMGQFGLPIICGGHGG